MQAIKFRNYTNEEFTWNFDGIAYTFAPNQEIFLEDFKAYFFAKHLADREMNRANIPTNDPRRAEFEARSLPADEPVSVDEAIDLEAKKGAKKGKKKVVEEEEFADLNGD